MTGKRFKPLYIRMLALEAFKNTPDPFFPVESKVRKADRPLLWQF